MNLLRCFILSFVLSVPILAQKSDYIKISKRYEIDLNGGEKIKPGENFYIELINSKLKRTRKIYWNYYEIEPLFKKKVIKYRKRDKNYFHVPENYKSDTITLELVQMNYTNFRKTLWEGYRHSLRIPFAISGFAIDIAFCIASLTLYDDTAISRAVFGKKRFYVKTKDKILIQITP